jgi:hypothetical protein
MIFDDSQSQIDGEDKMASRSKAQNSSRNLQFSEDVESYQQNIKKDGGDCRFVHSFK